MISYKKFDNLFNQNVLSYAVSCCNEVVFKLLKNGKYYSIHNNTCINKNKIDLFELLTRMYIFVYGHGRTKVGLKTLLVRNFLLLQWSIFVLNY